MPQIADAALQIFYRVIKVTYAKPPRCQRRELHQPDGALPRNSARIVVAFRFDDGVHEAGINVVAQCHALHEAVESSRPNNVMGRWPSAASRFWPFFGVFRSLVWFIYDDQRLAGRAWLDLTRCPVRLKCGSLL